MNRISVVIINKNDRGVSNTLTALETIIKPLPGEIIIVDGSRGKLDDIKKAFPAVKWIPYKNQKHKKITIPEQRNTGVLAASGDIIVFTDANCIPSSNWLKYLVEPIIKDGESIVAGVTRSQGKSTTHDQTYIRNKKKMYVEECPTINLAFTRKLYDEIGGFDECFDYGSDVDFSWRVIDAGYNIRYEPSAIVAHDWGDTKQELKRSYYYGIARARLHLKHKKIHYLISHDAVAVIYPIFLLGLPITIWWYWYPLLILIPFIKNYNKQPFHTIIYNLVYGIGVLREVFIHIRKKIL